MPKRKELKKIKSSLFSRSLSMANLSLKTGAKMAAHGLSQVMQTDLVKNERWNQFLLKQAKNLTTELGELKGSLMKAGQMLSVYGEHFFPPEANQFLRSLQQDTPALQWSTMEKILIDRWGKEKRNLLEIDPIAIGTASLGQVHRAKIKKTGQDIALKIQYPKVDKAIDSDLKAIKSFLLLVKLLPKDFDTGPIFQEIREMLLQETDYIQEAEWTDKYGKLLKGDQRFVVPKVIAEFSDQKVLATTFEEGLRVDDPKIQSLSQERRNKLALDFMDLYFKEIFEWHLVQTDPHFGNYRIRTHENHKDQVVLYDFGATRKYDDKFMNPYRHMVRAMFYNDLPAFEKSARKLKFIQENDEPELKKLFAELCFDLVEPFLEPGDPRNLHQQVNEDGTYDWKKTDLPQRSSKKVMQLLRNFKWRTPPKEMIFLDRKAAGVFVFLAHLRARIRGRELIQKYLDRD